MAMADYFSSWSLPEWTNAPVYQEDLCRFASPFISGNVLDLGCGSHVYYQTDRISSWTGTDCTPERLAGMSFAHGQPEDIHLVTADAPKLPFAAKTFDTVCCFFLLHHLGRKNRKKSATQVELALKEIHRVLREGGQLVVAENASCWLNWPYRMLFPVSFRIFSRIGGVLLPYFWTQKELQRMGRRSGFKRCSLAEIRQTEWIYQPVLGFKLPPFLDNRPLSTMTLFVFDRDDSINHGEEPK